MRKIFSTILLSALFLGAVGCGSQPVDATYRVTGDTSSVFIEAMVENGKILTVAGAKLPWETTFVAPRSQTLDISVTNEGDGEFIVEVLINGSVKARNSDKGKGAIVNLTYSPN